MSFDNLPDDVRSEIVKEIQAYQKISAIKRYKDATGSSLLESKKAIEALSAEVQASPSTVSEEQSSSSSDEILDAIFRSDKLEAVKLYRNSAGVSLREAKEFIEDLTDQLREEAGDQFKNGNSGCLGMVALAGFVGLLKIIAAMQV